MGYRLQDLDSSVELKVGAVHGFFVSLKRHHAPAYLDVVCPHLGEFLRQDGLQTHKGLGDDFKMLCHYVYLLIYAAKVQKKVKSEKRNVKNHTNFFLFPFFLFNFAPTYPK
jgi:hypothetical protein